jgi:hypothetical protein
MKSVTCQLFLGLALAVGHAHAQTTFSETVEGRSINFVVPDGYCVLGTKTEQERLWVEGQRELNKGRNTLVAVFADCKELARYRANPDARVTRHGQYALPLNNGKISPLPASYSRARALGEIKKALPKLEASTVQEGVNKRIEDVGFNRKDINIGNMNLGLLDETAEALFIGMGGVYEVKGKKQRVSGVTLFTMVNGILVVAHSYEDYSGADTFMRLLDKQKSLATRFVAANDASKK